MCIEKRVYMKTGGISIAMNTNPQGYREPYSRQIRNVGVRISTEKTCRSRLEDTRRKHPGESQRFKYRETCRGNVDSRIPGIPQSTVQKEDSNSKETVKKTDSTVREAPEQGLVNTGFEQESGIQSVQGNVEGVDHQHR